MVSKNNKKLIAEKNRRKEKQRFALRKLTVGLASVLLGVTFSIYGGGQLIAHADTTSVNNQEATNNTSAAGLVNKSGVTLHAIKTTETSASRSNKTVNNSLASDTNSNNAATDQADTLTANQVSNNTQAPVSMTSQFVNTSENTTNTSNVSVTVNNAQELIDAIQNSTANEINIGSDITLDSDENYITITHERDLTIQSKDTKHTIDFGKYTFSGDNNTSTFTFKNLNIISKNDDSLIQNNNNFVFDNVTYTAPTISASSSSITVKNNSEINITPAISSMYGGLYVTGGTFNLDKTSKLIITVPNGVNQSAIWTDSEGTINDAGFIQVNTNDF
ncbi:MAG: YSIRK-type signal peptide-containing protein, partial [Candidatus Limosilactobacillus intestinavium]